MIAEAATYGLKINTAMKNELVFGYVRAGGEGHYIAPDPTGKVHQSLTGAWWLLEWLPKSVRWMEWPRPRLLGYYIPNGEPRLVGKPNGTAAIHCSVIERLSMIREYKPVNLPAFYQIVQ
jgi:hypothetical protein